MTAPAGNHEATGPAREAYIKGLKDFADFLREHPEVPVWRHGQEFLFSPADGTEGVERIAGVLGTEVEVRPAAQRAVVRFGPHAYVAYAQNKQRAGAA